MPIAANDIKCLESANAGLGGAVTTTEIVNATVHNLFDKVVGVEAAAGDVEYRCFYVENGHATLTLEGAEIYILSNTPAAGSAVSIGLGSSAIDGEEQSIADEETAPTGVTFSQPGSGSPLAIGNLAPGQHKAIWVRRTITAGAAAYNNDNGVFRVQGDTAA